MRVTRLPLLIALAGCGSPSTAPDARTSAVALVDADRYAADLGVIAAPRAPGSAHWQRVQDMCAERFAELGFEVERHEYTTGVNVIGTRAGTTLPDERVVVSAHYDGTSTTCAGADDNATGVAGVLEAARVLAQAPHARTLVVACWDEEERGLIGSYAWVQRALAAGEKIVASFVFEMIGYRNTATSSQRVDAGLAGVFPQQTAAIHANQDRGDFILVIRDVASEAQVAGFEATAASVGLPVVTLPVSEMLKKSNLGAGLRRSDHSSFWVADIPAVQITDTAEFRNSNYHCNAGPDTLADIDIGFATQVTQATVGALESVLDPISADSR